MSNNSEPILGKFITRILIIIIVGVGIAYALFFFAGIIFGFSLFIVGFIMASIGFLRITLKSKFAETKNNFKLSSEAVFHI